MFEELKLLELSVERKCEIAADVKTSLGQVQ